MRSFVPGLVLLAAVGCGGPASRPAPAPTAEELAAEIAANNWWKTKPTPARVDQMAGLIQNAQQGDTIFIDDEGRLTILGAKEPVPAAKRLKRPDGVGERYFRLDIGPRDGRADRAGALALLRSTLNAAAPANP